MHAAHISDSQVTIAVAESGIRVPPSGLVSDWLAARRYAVLAGCDGDDGWPNVRIGNPRHHSTPWVSLSGCCNLDVVQILVASVGGAATPRKLPCRAETRQPTPGARPKVPLKNMQFISGEPKN